MPKLHLNEKAVARLKPDGSGKDTLTWDTDLRGFGVRCSAKTGSKVYVAQRDIGGKSVRVSIGAVNEVSFAKAKALAADALHGLRQGINPKHKPVVPTLQSALDAYLLARSNLSVGSVRMYKQIERTLSDWMQLPLPRISGDMVEVRHRELAAVHGKVSANFSMKTLGILWCYAADRNAAIPPNPIRRLRGQWYAEPRRERMVTAEQLPVFYQAVLDLADPIQRDFVLLLLFTGMRRSEAAGLRWADIDLPERMIRLPAEATKSKRKLDLPMSDVVRDMLVARRALGHTVYLFPGRSINNHLAANVRAFGVIAEATGIVVSAHDLRRTFASVAGSTEIPMTALKMLLNHSSGGDVTAGYVFLSVADLRAAAQKVADRLKALCEIEDNAGVARLSWCG